MAGDGQVTPNGSLHWVISQADENGPHDWSADVAAVGTGAAAGAGALAGATTARALSTASAGAGRPSLTVLDALHLHGVDPSPVSNFGVGKGHPGKMRVRLRFPSEGDARSAIAQAVTTLRKHDRPGESGDLWEITLDVTPKQRTEAEAQITPDNPYAQIRWDW